jgi:hypothetical protein
MSEFLCIFTHGNRFDAPLGRFGADVAGNCVESERRGLLITLLRAALPVELDIA